MRIDMTSYCVIITGSTYNIASCICQSLKNTVMSYKYRTLPSRDSHTRKTYAEDRPRIRTVSEADFRRQKRSPGRNKERGSASGSDGEPEGWDGAELVPVHRKAEQGKLHDILQNLSRRRKERQHTFEVIEHRPAGQEDLMEKENSEPPATPGDGAHDHAHCGAVTGPSTQRSGSECDSVSCGSTGSVESGESVALCRSTEGTVHYQRRNNGRYGRLPVVTAVSARPSPATQQTVEGELSLSEMDQMPPCSRGYQRATCSTA